eukprot:472112_1
MVHIRNMSTFVFVKTIYILYLFINGIESVTIKTTLGNIKGTENAFSWPGTTIYEFKGISYATAPLGSLRFRQAILNNTQWNSIYDATHYRSICIQSLDLTTEQSMSEDCLFLNIWTTKTNVQNAKNSNYTQLVPVQIFIHGGAFISGEGSKKEYSGLNYVGEYGGNFVYVSINYRLGPLGFLSNQQLYNEDPNFKSYGGLNGLYDQITAIKYIKKYIHSYGGNPNQITIFGESAGALSVCILLVTDMVPNNLFQRSLSESGSCIAGGTPWGPLSKDAGIAFSNQQLIGAGYPIDNITYLRSIPAHNFSDSVSMDPWSVSVDELILTDLPRNLFQTKNELNANEAIIFGFNSIDGVVSFPWHAGYAPKNDSEYKALIAKYILNITQQNEIYNIYYSPNNFVQYLNFNSYELAWWSMNGDVCLSCPTLKIGEIIALRKLTKRVYLYEFLGSGNDNQYYAGHASELPFVFDDVKSHIEFYRMPWNQNLSNCMVSAWTNYAKYGIPNVTNSINNIHIKWDEFSLDSGNVILFKQGNGGIYNVKNFTMNYRSNVCDFWYNQVGLDVMTNVCQAYR